MTETTLVDYVTLCGHDFPLQVEYAYETGSEGTSTTPENLKPPLHRGYSGRILAHYPHKRADATFSEEIFALCMPRGVRFCTERELPTGPSLHTFVNVKEDGSRVFGTAITFYEEVRDPNVCEQMVRLHMEHVRELTTQRNEMRSEREGRQHHAPGTVSGGTHTLPRKKQIDRSKRISYYDGGAHKQLYVSKTLCLITRLPMVFVTEAILRALIEMLSPKSDPPPLPLESYLYWILHEVPLPSPGTTLKVNMNGHPLVLQRPSPSELPFFDYPLSSLFDLLAPEKFLRLLTCFFLEHQILVCSKELSRLMLVCESLCSFAFPFHWSLAYAPILPYSQLKFIEAPVPYVMGLCYEEDLPESLFQSNVCVLDVDTGRVEFPEDVPTFPQYKDICAEMRNILKRFSAIEDTENQDLNEQNMTLTGENGDDECTPKMRAISTRRRGEWSYKRMSRSFDGDTLDGWMSGENPPPLPLHRGEPMNRPKNLPTLPIQSLMTHDSPLSRVSEIARRAGVSIDMAVVENELNGSELLTNSPQNANYFKEVKLSNALRETVLHRVVGMLYAYEHFVVGGGGCKDLETWEASRDSVVSFDKASFLSDQPDSHLAFLAAFLETQMFTDFIDEKIKSQWQPADENLKLFDARIKELQHRLGQSMVRTPTADTSKPFAQSEELISKRAEAVDYVVPAPHILSGAPPMRYEGCWPENFNGSVLEGPLGTAAPSPWKQRYRNRRPLEGMNGSSNSSVRPTSIYAGAQGLTMDTPNNKEQQLKFVEQLLKETKGKTKRMLVNKMGREAVLLGHGAEAGVGGVEENTLVAAFCDLLERVFSHGMIKKQGKSALWTYVLAHQDQEKSSQNGENHRSMASSMLTPGGRRESRERQSRETRPPRAPSRPRAVPYPGTRSRAPSTDSRTPEVDQENNRRERPIQSSLPGRTEGSQVNHPDQNGNLDQTASTSSTTLSDLVDSIQRELAMKEENEETPAWSKNFLKAANFLCDRIQEASRPKPNQRDPSPSRSLLSAVLSRPQIPMDMPSLPPSGPRRLKKCSSVSDFSTPGFGVGVGSSREGTASVEGSPRRRPGRSQSRPRSPDGRVVLPSLPTHIAYDLKNVVRMAEIKTDIGYARAFVRLALERKLLHRHLAALLSNSQLIRDLYKPYSFARCEDEKEQFLYHVLSLNAANYRCYTNTFTKTKMDYQVVVVTGSWRGALPAVWMCIEGSLATTPTIRLPEGTPLFKFDHRNLGILSTLRIGHSVEDERPSKWFLDYIVVRNEITGQMYRFPCGRWFGKGVDDGSLERLLVAEPIQEFNPETSELGPSPFSPARGRRMERDSSVTRERSPSSGRNERDNQPRTKKQKMLEVEQQLGDSVNSIVKHFYSEKESKSELARLLCGERGLVPTLEAVFQFGRQDSIWTSRLFRQNYPWDYIEKVSNWFFEFFRRGEAEKLSRGQKELVGYSLKLVRKISEKSVLGKDGKFHVFILITIRDHVLAGLLQLMSWTPITAQLYEEVSFLRSPSHMAHTSKLLEALNEFHFHIEKSLTYGIV